MAAAQHKLSRREVLAGACVAPVAALPRHCEPPEAIQSAAAAGAEGGLPRRFAPRNDDAVRNDGWRKALLRYLRAEAEIEALAHSEDQNAYDRAVGRHIGALGRLLRSPAPDLAAAAWKLELVVRHSAWELRCGEAAFEILRRDLARFAAPPRLRASA